MADLIDRKMAIDAFRKELCAEETESARQYAIGFLGIERVLNDLPSAQFATDINVGDTISRKMAIDFIDYLLSKSCTGDNGDFVGGMRVGYHRARVGIKNLPSAQPEREKGKWLTVSGRLGNEVECSICHDVFWIWMNNYSFCPRCGADMRGENDGT